MPHFINETDRFRQVSKPNDYFFSFLCTELHINVFKTVKPIIFSYHALKSMLSLISNWLAHQKTIYYYLLVERIIILLEGICLSTYKQIYIYTDLPRNTFFKVHQTDTNFPGRYICLSSQTDNNFPMEQFFDYTEH